VLARIVCCQHLANGEMLGNNRRRTAAASGPNLATLFESRPSMLPSNWMATAVQS
jgi:hypothetical protein